MRGVALADQERVTPLFFIFTPIFICVLIFGSGAGPGFFADLVLQFLSLPLLVVALWRITSVSPSWEIRKALMFCAAIVSIPLLQLVPLPSIVWTRIPGRAGVAEYLELLGRDLPWEPISLVPSGGWLSALSLIPPLSIFLCGLVLDYDARRKLSLILLFVGVGNVFVGLMQFSRGLASPLWYSQQVTPGEAVGFFLNRNHFAALLYSLIPLVAALIVSGGDDSYSHTRRRTQNFKTGSLLTNVAGFVAVVTLIAGVLVARSRAGAVLTIVALFGALTIAYRSRNTGDVKTTPVRLMLAATAVAILFSSQFALYRIFERFDFDRLSDARIEISRNTLDAAKAMTPFGAGQGAFVTVYAIFENPKDVVANSYINHAHNEFLEVWLESGLLGLVLIVIFAVWFAQTSMRVWRTHSDRSILDQSLPRASTLIILLLATHSVVDYPLRTGALASVFAFSCACLFPPFEQKCREMDEASGQ